MRESRRERCFRERHTEGSRTATSRLTTPSLPTRPGYMARKVSKRVPALNAVTRKISKRVRKVTAAKGKKLATAVELDLRGFSPESLLGNTLGLCLACALDVLTRHMGLSVERARSEIRRYNPRLEELTTASLARPYMVWPAEKCPYCAAPPKWHAPLKIVRIEGERAQTSLDEHSSRILAIASTSRSSKKNRRSGRHSTPGFLEPAATWISIHLSG